MAINVLVKIYTKSKAKVISMYYLRCTLPTEDAMALGNECISKDIHKNLNKKSSHVPIKVYIFSLDGCGLGEISIKKKEIKAFMYSLIYTYKSKYLGH